MNSSKNLNISLMTFSRRRGTRMLIDIEKVVVKDRIPSRISVNGEQRTVRCVVLKLPEE